VDGSGRASTHGAVVASPVIEPSLLKHDLDDLEDALKSLRDADAGRVLPALYRQVMSDVERLLKAFVL
jgi:hypothetical protein